MSAALELVYLALSLLNVSGANKAAVLVQIVGKARQAYEDETGAPMDLSLIKPE